MENNLLTAGIGVLIRDVDNSCAMYERSQLKLIQVPGHDIELQIAGKSIVVEQDELSQAIDFLQTLRVKRDTEMLYLQRQLRKLETDLAKEKRKNQVPAY